MNEVAACQKCGLCKTRTHTVFGEGNCHARIMFIGEGPGRDENDLGRPFVGRAGQLLDKMLGSIALTRNDVYIANVLKCRPGPRAGGSGRVHRVSARAGGTDQAQDHRVPRAHFGEIYTQSGRSHYERPRGVARGKGIFNHGHVPSGRAASKRAAEKGRVQRPAGHKAKIQ